MTVQEVCSGFAVSLSVKQGTTYRDTPILISYHLFSFDISEAPLSMLVPFHQSSGRANPRNAPRDSSRGYVPVRAVARSLSDAWDLLDRMTDGKAQALRAELRKYQTKING